MTNPTMFEDYEILFDEGGSNENAKVRIKGGDYEGVTYYYQTVSIKDAEDGSGEGILNFNYIVTENEDKIKDKSSFEHHIGDILVDIIERQIQWQEIQEELNADDDRENDNNESTEQ